MSKRATEAAFKELRQLLGGPDPDEDTLQTYFESHPIVLELMGFANAKPKVRLPLEDGQWLEPDFLGVSQEGTGAMIDLKLTSESIIRRKTHRDRFYAKIEDHIAQVSRYAEYFDEAAHREDVLRQHGIKMPKDPFVYVIVGRLKEVSAVEIHHLLNRHKRNLFILTYDQILMELYRIHQVFCGEFDGLPGISLHMVASLDTPRAKDIGYIADFGSSEGSRVSIHIDHLADIHFDAKDDNGRSRRVSIAPKRAGYEVGKWSYFSFEFCSGKAGTRMLVRVDGTLQAQYETDTPMVLDAAACTSNLTFGTDLSRELFARFAVAEYFIVTRALTLEEQVGTFEYMLRDLEGEDGYTGPSIRFTGSQYMVSEEGGGDRKSLVAAPPGHQPLWIPGKQTPS